MPLNAGLFSFVGGDAGRWRILSSEAVTGEGVPVAARLEIVNSGAGEAGGAEWILRGVTSNKRYVIRTGKDALLKHPNTLDRTGAVCAALIPIRQNAARWKLTQDERQSIFEDRSSHIRTGLKYLPAVARRLYQCRDLEPSRPFDFITPFDCAPEHSAAFEQMAGELRATEEWQFADRETDIRMEWVRA